MAELFNTKNNFCALPFGHTSVATNGDFSVCCIHKTPIDHTVNINKSNFNKWNSSEYLSQVRNSFRLNQQHPGCYVCWQKEELGQVSMRTRNQKEYQILGVTDQTEFPVDLEIRLGNLCNLKCLMCNETESSGILAENIQLGINQYNQKDFQWNETGFEHLQEIIASRPKIISIRGGEPFYNKPLLDIIENLPSDTFSQTMLHVSTNATVWNDRWKSALEKFKLVRLMFSVDATDDLYEYIRFQGKWKDTDSNIGLMMSGKNVKSLVHCVVQNLNIQHLGSMINWARKKGLYLQLEPLNHPSWLAMSNLPDTLKQKAIDHLDEVLTWDLAQHERDFVTVSRTQLTNSQYNHELWQTFQAQIGMRDRLRNNSYTRFLQG